MKNNTKEITLIGLVSALQIVITLYFQMFSLLSLIVFVLALTKKQAIALTLVSSIINCLISFNIMTVANIGILLLICLMIKKYQEIRLFECTKSQTISNQIELGTFSFIIIFISNFILELLAMIIYDFPIEYLIISLPINLIGALINGLLIGIMALTLNNIICKLLLRIKL